MSESLVWMAVAALGLYLFLMLGVVQFLRLVRKRDRDLRQLTATWIAQQSPLS